MDSRQRSILQLPLVSHAYIFERQLVFLPGCLWLLPEDQQIFPGVAGGTARRVQGASWMSWCLLLDASAGVWVRRLNSKDVAIFGKCSRQT